MKRFSLGMLLLPALLGSLHVGSVSAGSSPLPQVEGEITSLAASPDGERGAFVVERENQPDSVGLLDLKTGKLLTQSPISDEFVAPGLTWAPDSSYVCLREPGDNPFALSRDGRRQTLNLGAESPGGLLWRAKPTTATLVYSARHGEGEGIYELDVRSGKRRLVRPAKRLGLELHRVHGAPCFIALDQKQDGRGRWVRVLRFDDGRPVFRLWLPRQDGPVLDPAEWDGPALSVSPDGKFFFVAGQVSASTFDLLGRVDEAGTLFRKPHHAIAYFDGRLSGHSVQWVPAAGKTQWAVLKERGTGKLDALIDPETGARYEERFPGVVLLEFLPNGDQVGVDASGLPLNSLPTLDWTPQRRLVQVRKDTQ